MISYDIYKNSVKEQFYFLKKDKSVIDSMIKSISIKNLGYLTPLNFAHLENDEMINLLTKFKMSYCENSISNEINKDISTKDWLLTNMLEKEDNILFLAFNNSGKFLASFGFKDCFNEARHFEINCPLEKINTDCIDIIGSGVLSMINWASTTFTVSNFNIKILKSNKYAQNFFNKYNFHEFEELSQNKITDDDTIQMRYESNNQAGENMILTAGPSISHKEIYYAYDAAKNGWNNQWSGYLSKLESTFSKCVNAKYAIATSSCTGALQIALMSLDIGRGDEVIVPDITWVASANAVCYVGATPIFADVELDTWNIDANSIEKLITEKTKAIMVVHMYGNPARMDLIMDVAKKYNLKVIEDSAPAIGAKFKNKYCGTFGSFGAFSFQGAKLLVTGEGGMLVTDNKELFQKAQKIANTGRNPEKGVFWIDGPGVKFKMSNVQAAIGLGQIERVNELISMKRRIFSWYERELSNIKGLSFHKEIDDSFSIYWMTSLRLDEDLSVSRDQLIKELKMRNVDTRPVFPAISTYPIWSKKQKPQEKALLIGNTSLNLPSGVCLAENEIVYICDQIKSILRLG